MPDPAVESSDLGSSKQELAIQMLYRDINDRINDRLSGDGAGEFICECVDEACVEMFRVPREEYLTVRTATSRFVILPGHRIGTNARVVYARDGFWVVDEASSDGQRAHGAGQGGRQR